jgi:hypothetical protein
MLIQLIAFAVLSNLPPSLHGFCGITREIKLRVVLHSKENQGF